MFKLKIGPRLISGFLATAALTAIVSVISYVEMKKIEVPLMEDIPAGLKQIERTSHLDSIAQRINQYHHLMTESARSYVVRDDWTSKRRYQELEVKLESIIKDAIERGDEEDKKIFSSIYNAKKQFVEMEANAFRLVNIGERAQAVEMLEAPDYWKVKEEYKAGLQTYLERRGKQYGYSLEVTSEKVDKIVRETHQTVESSIQLLVMISLAGIVFAFLLSAFVSRSILNPLKTLQEGAKVIGKGNLNYRIPVQTEDEIGELAKVFNEMTQKLKESYEGLEEKVREKTLELANKVAEIEQKNRVLEKTEQDMSKALNDLAAAKERIEKEKVEYEALLASIGEGMLAINQQGKVMMMNTRAETMLNRKKGEVLDRYYDEVFTIQDERGRWIPSDRHPVRLALSSGRAVTMSAYYVKKDGSKFPVATTISPIILNQKTMGAIGIFRDITKEKEIDHMKSELISTVSHELRTPLTVIREGVALVMEGVLGPATEEQKKFLSVSLEDIDRLKRIIDNLLDVSKIEAGKVGLKRELVDICAVTEGAAATFQTRAKNKGLEIKTTLPSKQPFLMYMDRDKVIQVFTNLIGNAMKFTEKGWIEAGVKDSEGFVECWVKDTGRGIAEADLSKVFGQFEQFGREAGSGEKGTGLGLAISRGIVQLHGGRIRVESKLHIGTSFIFTLPKFSDTDLLKECVAGGLREAVKDGADFSIIFYQIQQAAAQGEEPPGGVVRRLEEIAKKAIRQQGDTLMKDTSSILITLSKTNSQSAQRVAEKLQGFFDEFLAKERLKSKVEIHYRVAAYPMNGTNEEELLRSVGVPVGK